MNNNVKHLSVRVKINAPTMNVFRAVTNWEEQDNWVFLTKVKGVGNDSQKLGGKLEAYTGIGRFCFLDTMTITAWDPPKLCEVTHTGNVVKGRGIFEVATINSSTYFTWTEYVEIPFGVIGRFGWIFIKPLTKLGLWVSLRRLAAYIKRK